MNLAKFKLLMWKNFRLRRFHWIMTLMELILPILVAYGLAKISSVIPDSGPSIRNATYPKGYTKEEILNYVHNIQLVYTPSNDFTDSLMEKVNATLKTTDIMKMENETVIEQYISKYNKSESHYNGIKGVIFYNIVSNNIPEKLNYALRDTNVWDTRLLYPVSQDAGPSHNDPYLRQGFAAIQLVINDEFIQMKTKQNTKPVIWQPFPYPEYIVNEGLKASVPHTIYFIVLVTVLIISIPLINDIIEEKDSGVKELMKLTGLEEWMIWLSWFIHAFVVSAISYTMVTIILKESGAIQYVTFPVIWTILMMYCIANISFCFLFCAIFHRATIATSVFLIAFTILVFGMAHLDNTNVSVLQKLSCIFPVGALKQGFGKISYFETQGIEFTWSSLTLVENDGHSVSLLFALGMLFFDTFLYFFLAFYITAVNPGKFGVRKSPFFIFQGLLDVRKSKTFKEIKSMFSKFKDNHTQPLRNLDDKADSEFIESPPANLEATIQIKDLYKNFGSFNAVDGVNLNIFKGEITALLGHNGAGKTTTMSILTGLTSPSAGSIYYRDIDVFQNMNLFRENLGMCPQEDRLFPYLSVFDHLLFFGMLKGVSKREATQEANEYLTLMELHPKKTALGKELSGGMKRKLCLSISLMGKADTLILDEPTSGMDVQSRRKIWDLLLEMRGNRTIILTTHYMEEADALGDRIAIMHHGSIVCHGTPIFLKKAYGTGYELTIVKEVEETNNLTQIVQSIIPNSTEEYQTANEVVYKLPLTETSKFPNLFQNLETSKSRLGIKSMGVACTTMEHVFLKVGGVSIYESQKPTRNTTVTDAGPHSMYLKTTAGLKLVIQQVSALLQKKILFTKRNLFGLFTRIILPTIIVALLLRSLEALDRRQEPSLDLSLSTYPGSMVMLQKNDNTSNLDKFYTDYATQHGASVISSTQQDIVEGLLTFARKELLKFNKNLITAAEINETNYKVLYNLWEKHSLPIAINTYSNVILRDLEKSDQVGILAQNHPVQPAEKSTCEFLEAQIVFYVMWYFALAFYTVDVLAYFTGFINMERLNGFKHIQLMSNVSPTVYWLGTLTFDFVFFLIIIALRMLSFKIFDYYNFLSISPALGSLVLVIILTGISGLLFVYVISFLSGSKDGSYTLLFIVNAISGIIVAVFFFVESLGVIAATKDQPFNQWILLFYVTKYVILLVPPLNYSLLFIRIVKTWSDNSRCAYCPPSKVDICKATMTIEEYLVQPSDAHPNGLMLGIEYLIIDIALYAVILALGNAGYVNHWFNQLKIRIFGGHSTNSDEGDSDVQREYEKVQSYKDDASKLNSWTKRQSKMRKNKLSDTEINESIPLRGITPNKKSRQAALLVNGLRKNYFVWDKPFHPPKFFKPFTAVADVNFVVEPGECFGLLGVNGAGKTTTFKMLTTDVLPTKGDAAIEGIKLSTNTEQYMSMAGYCAQTNCFIEELTGREMLKLIASLRGVTGNDVTTVVDKWISILGLEEYQNRNCGSYSGGNKRKLCTAMSLIGDPRVVFLDEPTSGVDPVSRRKLYDVMGQSKEAGQAVVLTSHSMEECETLCDRLTIMAAGVMKCIGTAQHLKKRYAQGFSLLVKIRSGDEVKEKLQDLKSDLIEVFSSKDIILKDEHRGMLYYQIKDVSLHWSTLFERMEDIKNRHYEVVDDYVLTDTTLEEVFISFAKSNDK